ncbi:MBL fold metallo-hydrolase [Sphingobium sp. YR768]|uniref:MBL fold metallo-hydrolase n=1 Tax=Sphingobium sp. YR768 TaxID=1884365 RepID=UPI0008CA067B|nr:MBL fold metallo-hydrolase [Sphingobium sp. YR768]SER26962.1 Glyoxylase, beta-lactamase superfamily II [Sphingobium sp. YR768]
MKDHPMKQKMAILLAAAGFLVANPAVAKPLEMQVIPTSVNSMHANMTLILGEKSAVLVDAPFSRADAHRVVAAIVDSGKRLETILITHDHPDHFFGLDVLKDAFPEAKVVAHPIVVKDITRSIPIKFERWSPLLGTNAPQQAVIPVALTGDSITLEGHKLTLLGPMQGDHARATALWDGETQTLIAGDLLYNGIYVWLGEHLKPQYDGWRKTLDTLAAMDPARIIAGHTRPGLPDDSYAIEWTRAYIDAFEREAKTARSSRELGERMRALYPTAVDVAGGFLVGVSSQVGTGEIPPWDE